MSDDEFDQTDKALINNSESAQKAHLHWIAIKHSMIMNQSFQFKRKKIRNCSKLLIDKSILLKKKEREKKTIYKSKTTKKKRWAEIHVNKNKWTNKYLSIE